MHGQRTYVQCDEPSHTGSPELAQPFGLQQARTCHNRGLLIMAKKSPTEPSQHFSRAVQNLADQYQWKS
jgi:hypothetical protein